MQDCQALKGLVPKQAVYFVVFFKVPQTVCLQTHRWHLATDELLKFMYDITYNRKCYISFLVKQKSILLHEYKCLQMQAWT